MSYKQLYAKLKAYFVMFMKIFKILEQKIPVSMMELKINII